MLRECPSKGADQICGQQTKDVSGFVHVWLQGCEMIFLYRLFEINFFIVIKFDYNVKFEFK